MSNIYPHEPFVLLYQDSYLMQLGAMRPLCSFLLLISWDVTNYWVQTTIFRGSFDNFWLFQLSLASRESFLQRITLVFNSTNIRTAFSPLLNILQMNWPRKHACIHTIYLPSKHKYAYSCIFCGFLCLVFAKLCLYLFPISLPVRDHFSLPVFKEII